MATLAEQAGFAAGQAARTVICGGGGFLLDNLPSFGPSGRAGREFARGVHGAVCGLPVPPSLGEPTPGPPAQGQCPGVSYVVTIVTAEQNRFTCATRVGGAAVGGFIGPIRNIFLGAPATMNCGGLPPQSVNVQVSWNTPAITGNLYQPSGGGNWAVTSITSINIARADGQPDNCGQPGPPIPPPPPGPIPVPPDIDLPVTPPGGGPDVNFNFSPRVGPIFIGGAGGLFIPVNVRVNGPNINVNAPVTIPVNIGLPDFNISFGGGADTSPDPPNQPLPPVPPPRIPPSRPILVCCDTPARPGPEVEAPEGEPVVGPPSPARRRLIGIVVRSTINEAVLSATEIGQGGGERNLRVPRIANAYFVVRATTAQGAPRIASTADSPVKLVNQYVPAPEGVEVIDWRVVPELGVAVAVTPVYVQSN